ncbi:MAG: DcaP family trimeric outer membrane transporter [Bacteroidales bacterium]|nr:DcaP family trimeric outer membrane transporter [Bacteroidales bacterium]
MKKLVTLLIVSILCINSYSQSTPSKNAESKSPFLIEKGNTTIKFGSFVRFVTFADFDGVVPNYDFISSTMSAPNQWDKQSRLSMDASGTRLNMKAVQKLEGFGDIEFFVEADFRGTGDALRLRHAYISFKGLTVGQSWSFMTDFLANAPTIDVQGVSSRTFFRTPLIGYKGSFNDKLSYGISLDFPIIKITATSATRVVNQRYPDIPLFLMYKGKRAHLKLAGVLRAIDYGVNSTEKVETLLGAGVQISGSIKLTDKFMLVSQGIYGKGVARYINDLAALNLDLVPSSVSTSLQTLPMYSLSLGARADLSKKLYGTANFSVAALANKKDYYLPAEYYKGNYFSASLFWTGVKNLTIAGEYLHGYRLNMNDTHGTANRVQLMFMYSW